FGSGFGSGFGSDFARTGCFAGSGFGSDFARPGCFASAARGSAALVTTPDAGSYWISLTGPLSRAGAGFTTPRAGVTRGAACGFDGSDDARHSALQYAVTLAPRTATCRDRRVSTGLPQVGHDALMGRPAPPLRRASRSAD